MRVRAVAFAVLALAGVGAGAFHLAEAAAAAYENATRNRIAGSLKAAGHDWVSLEVDGLEVVLSGEAPDESTRFSAVQATRRVVDDWLIQDAMTIRTAAPLAPPHFALEFLRNDDEVSLIGLVPAEQGPADIKAALAGVDLDRSVTDMLETAEHPAPEGWSRSLGFALDLLKTLPRAKISLQTGRVGVEAVVDSNAERVALDARLREAAPEGVALTLNISAPRPIIAPFEFDYALVDGKGQLVACTAETEEDAAAIVRAVRDAGLTGEADCAIGLGAPSPDWAAAVALGIDALRRLGGGRFALKDIDALLTGPELIAPDRLKEAGMALDAELPAIYSLETLMPPRMVDLPEGGKSYAPQFDAVLTSDGSVELTGALQNPTSRAAVESYASALFGHDRVVNTTVIDPQLPEGWPGKVLAGVEGLAQLKEGRLAVTLDALALEGWSVDADADSRLEQLFSAKLGDSTSVDVRYNAEAAAAENRSPPEICAEEIAAILEAGSIQFAAGSAEIEPASQGVIAAIADVLRICPGANFEIGGHTDSQGGADANQRLSEERAKAVVAALEAQDLPLIRLRARGYGASLPIASNDSAKGRGLNRRIEMTLFDDSAPEPAPEMADAAEPPVEACTTRVEDVLASDTIQFGLGSAAIEAESAPIISQLADAMRDCRGMAFEIGGHTDDRGRAEVNQRLSKERAEAVVAALEEEGLEDVELSAEGYGEDHPVSDNDTSEGRARNRRIEITAAKPAVDEDVRTARSKLGPQ